jgi:hypothetical protein
MRKIQIQVAQMIFTILETYCEADGQDATFKHPDITAIAVKVSFITYMFQYVKQWLTLHIQSVQIELQSFSYIYLIAAESQSWYVCKIWCKTCPSFSDLDSREMAAPHHDKLRMHESGSHSVMAS